MKTNRLVVYVIAALFIISSCSKKDSPAESTPQPEEDYSQCLLSEVKYSNGVTMPYYYDPFTLTYDSLKRITTLRNGVAINLFTYEPGKIIQLFYLNSITDSNLYYRYIYLLDNNGRATSHARYSYNRPKSVNDYYGLTKTDYEYNTDGYLIGKKDYANGKTLVEERKYTYQGGNQTQRINIYYQNPVTIRGADTITYTYDTTAWFPEAAHLVWVIDGFLKGAMTGKPNKNNITGIGLKMYHPGNENEYKSIQYGYAVKGKRLEKVTMTASTIQGNNFTTSIDFKYQCN